MPAPSREGLRACSPTRPQERVTGGFSCPAPRDGGKREVSRQRLGPLMWRTPADSREDGDEMRAANSHMPPPQAARYGMGWGHLPTLQVSAQVPRTQAACLILQRAGIRHNIGARKPRKLEGPSDSVSQADCHQDSVCWSRELNLCAQEANGTAGASAPEPRQPAPPGPDRVSTHSHNLH